MTQATDLISRSADARQADAICEDTISCFENWHERNARLYTCADGSVVAISYEAEMMSAHADIYEARDAVYPQRHAMGAA
jgi:hypothetical protein